MPCLDGREAEDERQQYTLWREISNQKERNHYVYGQLATNEELAREVACEAMTLIEHYAPAKMTTMSMLARAWFIQHKKEDDLRG
tara:strand:- start:1206 stop:1460 length:255 start_codon:yes stop_codon:yes gene_type:complete